MWFNKLDKQLDKEINEITRVNEGLRSTIADLQRQVQEYQNRLNGEYAKASYSINWDVMCAFSIERMREGDTNKTIIGYILSEPVVTTEGDKITYKDVVREWTLYCSHEEHQRLVKEFDKWKAAKNGL